MKVLFIINCIPYFPSGIVRVLRFFPFLDGFGINYRLISYNSTRVQRWLEWLDLSWFGKYKLSDFIVRVLIHLSGIPYQAYTLIRVLWLSQNYDLIFFQAVLPPAWYTQLLSHLNKRIVFDYDDALYVNNEGRAKSMICSSWKICAGSHVLFDYAKQFNSNVYLVPSSIPIKKYNLQRDSKRTPLCVGWIGGVSTLNQLQLLRTPISNLIGKGYQFNILIAGSQKNLNYLEDIEGIKLIEVPCYTDDDIPELVNQIDIGVMPLFDNPRERGKCALKTLIYMAGKIPVICSPVGEANYIIQPAVNGYFATTPEEWTESLELLLQNEQVRKELGRAGGNTVDAMYSDEIVFQILNREIFQPIMDKNKS